MGHAVVEENAIRARRALQALGLGAAVSSRAEDVAYLAQPAAFLYRPLLSKAAWRRSSSSRTVIHHRYSSQWEAVRTLLIGALGFGPEPISRIGDALREVAQEHPETDRPSATNADFPLSRS